MKKKRMTHVVLSIAVFLIAFPLLFALIKATQSPGQVMSARLLPGTMFISNVRSIWENYSFYRYMLNSMKISLIIMFGKTFLSFFAAFALVFMSFRGKKVIFAFILVTLMMPTEMLIIGMFDLVSLQPPAGTAEFLAWFAHPLKVLFEPVRYGFGWTDKAVSVIVPFLASATGVFLFRQHFRNIPGSLMDASLIDGAGPWRFIFHVLFPLSRNTVGALFVVQFVYAWNQYLWPRVIIRNESAQVVQVGLKALIGNAEGVEWGQVMAGAVITMIPPLIILILLHDQFMKGIALSDSK
ncbi:MAG: carbohydrate ABC transporter permease [Spirochaetales bacterium]|nr:carbohydrate ABC transporter permease [Spirochaetales bacterium]